MEGITIPIPSAGWIDAAIMAVVLFVSSKWPPAGDLIKKILGQRKTVFALLAAAIPFVNAKFGWNLSTEAMLASAAPLMAWFGGEFVRDVKVNGNGHAAPPAPK